MAQLPTALVTGAARGIGLAVARWFLDHGHAVAALDIDGPELVQATAALGGPERVLALVADVSDPKQVADAFARVDAHFGRLDALVNNAAIAIFNGIAETSYYEWRRIFEVNLDGPFLCSQAAAPLLARQGGSIVNIASISGLRASTLRVAYGTSKAALIHLTKQQAVEFASANIRVNAIAPGPVETAMAQAVHTAAIRADYYDAIPLNRYGLPEEIAAAIGFLCTPAAGYITGQVLAVDGGFDATGIGLPTLRGSLIP